MAAMRIVHSLCLLAFCATFSLTAAEQAGKPNILIILADDLGYGELGCQGNPQIPTPHIDSIARNGMRFTQGYVSGPYCSPTRAGLMTGKYQTRFGHEFNGSGPKFGLPATEKTMADHFKAAGYATCAIGKWHLGNEAPFRPTRRGFDEFYGTLANTSFFHPRNFVDSRVSEEVQEIKDATFYTTDAFAERAVDWLEKHKNGPWFLYLPFNAQHAPLEAPQKYLDRFDHITSTNRRIFAAMLSAMDDAIGRVLNKVRDLKQEERTLIFFLADNGGPTRSTTSTNGPLRGFKSTTWEGGVRVPFALQWKGAIPAGKTFEHPVIQLDILPTSLAAAGEKLPAKLDGVNLLPYLTGKKKGMPHETLYWRFGPQWAVRHGDWKLVKGNGGGNTPELYNLRKDIGESINLAGAEPQKAKELQSLWDRWNSEQTPPAWQRAEAGRRRRAPPAN